MTIQQQQLSIRAISVRSILTDSFVPVDPFCSKGYARVKGNHCEGNGVIEPQLYANALLMLISLDAYLRLHLIVKSVLVLPRSHQMLMSARCFLGCASMGSASTLRAPSSASAPPA